MSASTHSPFLDANCLLQGYGIRRQDHAQRIIRHLTSLYAPELLKQLQADDAAADKQGRPGITFCVEGNISAGKSTFLGYITQGNEQLQQELGVSRGDSKVTRHPCNSSCCASCCSTA